MSQVTYLSISFNGSGFYPVDATGLLKPDQSPISFFFYAPLVINKIISDVDYEFCLDGNIPQHQTDASVVFAFRDGGPTVRMPAVTHDGKLRCCQPEGLFGCADIYISLNAQQYSKCSEFCIN